MKQLKREIKAATEAKQAVLEQDVRGLDSDDEMEEAPYNAVSACRWRNCFEGEVQLAHRACKKADELFPEPPKSIFTYPITMHPAG